MRDVIGQRVAHYSITAHLGSGGMGDVYQATDMRLGRSVALKFLPEAFAHDQERVLRFEREAKALASLNHPNIAALHGLEDACGQAFLVMELVPGETLHERIHRAPMALDEAVAVARQIAEALEAAHEKGIVHRDLKPANVKITPEGRVKVLDFGLAKLVAEEAHGLEQPRGAAVSNSPTMSALGTHAGVILGTAAYMAPEQARGRPVDQRADIFAFGCLLYEMLTGRPAFEGENAADILSGVLQRDPEWGRLPPGVPPSIHRLLHLCLEKDPRKRRQAAGDVRLDLEHALTEPVVASSVVASGRRPLPAVAWATAAFVLIAALTIPVARHLREVPPQEMRLQIVTPPAIDPLDFALSPDGRYLVFVATGASGEAAQRLYLRALDQTEARPLAGTEGARFPFWSPDSHSVGFFASEQVLRIDIAGGPRSRWPPPPTRRAARGGPTRSSLRQTRSARSSRFLHRAVR
jgi:serine/threonine protein kinase